MDFKVSVRHGSSQRSAVARIGIEPHGLGQLWLLRRATLLMVFAVSLMLPAHAAASSQFSWSSTVSLDPDGGPALSAVACPTATQCTAVDVAERELTFDPQGPGTPTPTRIPANDD